MTDGYYTYRGDHIITYIHVESLSYTPKFDMILYNYTLIFKKLQFFQKYLSKKKNSCFNNEL